MGGLGAGHKGLYDTVNNSLHFQLGLALASVGTICSLVAYLVVGSPYPSCFWSSSNKVKV